MSTIIVGDLHGKYALARELLEDKNQSILFVGDYLDSFTIDPDTQIALLDLVLDACETRENVVALLGNHELSYIDPNYRCSGFNFQTYEAVQNRLGLMHKHLRWYAVVGDYLVTHAGVSRAWLPHELNTLKEAVVYIEETSIEKFGQIGYHRGGSRYAVGGPLWCDAYFEFKPIKGLKQVFGHTAYRAPDQGIGILEDYEDNFNIDCLDRCLEVLEVTEHRALIKTL